MGPAGAAMLASVSAEVADPVEFIGAIGTTTPSATLAVNANTENGDWVIATGGNATHVDINFDADVDMEDNDNGSGVCVGSGRSEVADNTHTFTASVSLHRMRSYTFRNVANVASNTPTFSGSSTSMVFSGTGLTIPPGGARILCAGYCTSTNGSFTPPAGFTAVSSNGFTPAMLSDDILTSFTSATATLGNSVVKGMQVFAIS